MNEKSRLILRVVAGLYLAYLGIQMIRGLIADRPENFAFMAAMAVIFIVVGIGFVIFSAKNVIALKNEEPETEQEGEEDTKENSITETEENIETVEVNDQEAGKPQASGEDEEPKA